MSNIIVAEEDKLRAIVHEEVSKLFHARQEPKTEIDTMTLSGALVLLAEYGYIRQNERLRSAKVCMELTRKYGLYIAKGKENVKRNRLIETDKTKYEIYDVIKASLSKCRNWQELTAELKRQGITIDFSKNGSTDKIQGIRFEKGNYTFNGSQIDRSGSYSRIDFQLKQNSREQEISLQPPKQDDSHNQSSVSENIGSVLGGLFDFQPSGTDYDPDEAEFQRQHKLRKKKKKRGFHL
jgi:hypothetical protein